MPIVGGRQQAETIAEIRDDHRLRYVWAASRLKDSTFRSVLDIGCGVGYGSYILATEAKLDRVVAIDNSEEALAYAKEHYAHDNIEYILAELDPPKADLLQNLYDAAVAFEIIEHVEHAGELLTWLPAQRLLGSVPNEAVVPFNPNNPHYHKRHYTSQQLGTLLWDANWFTSNEYSQKAKHGVDAEIEPGPGGRTIVFDARRR